MCIDLSDVYPTGLDGDDVVTYLKRQQERVETLEKVVAELAASLADAIEFDDIILAGGIASNVLAGVE